MKKYEILPALLSQLQSQRWFPQELDPKHCSSVHLQEFSASVYLLRLCDSWGQDHVFLFPWDNKLGFMWQSPHWLNLLSPSLALDPGFALENFQLLTDSSHPCLLGSKSFVKFFPNLSDPGLAREWSLASELGTRSEFLFPSQQLKFQSYTCALCYSSIPEAQNAWDYFESLNKAEMLAETQGLAQKISHSFAASRTPLQKLEISPKLRDYLGLELDIEFQSSLAHLDCHLGQWLKSPHQDHWTLIDFGACPAPNPWWTSPACLEMDLASMFRSLDYRLRSMNLPGLDSTELLDLCQSQQDADPRLIALALLARNLYEIDYEKNFRPDWLEIPQAALETSLQVFLRVY